MFSHPHSPCLQYPRVEDDGPNGVAGRITTARGTEGGQILWDSDSSINLLKETEVGLEWGAGPCGRGGCCACGTVWVLRDLILLTSQGPDE